MPLWLLPATSQGARQGVACRRWLPTLLPWQIERRTEEPRHPRARGASSRMDVKVSERRRTWQERQIAARMVLAITSNLPYACGLTSIRHYLAIKCSYQSGSKEHLEAVRAATGLSKMDSVYCVGD